MRNSGRTRWALGVALFAAFIGGASSASAQTGTEAAHQSRGWLECDVDWIVGDHDHRGPDFTVKVSFRSQQISGVKVSLTRETAPLDEPGRFVVATGDTDSDGDAHFFAIPLGMYKAHVDEGLLSPNEEIEVETKDASSDEVLIEWPLDPIVTRSVRGWITSWQKSSPQNRSQRLPLQHVLVQLLDLRTAKLLASTYTSPEGYYEFPASEDGLYVVRVSEDQDPSPYAYDRAVEVTSHAHREQMPGLDVDNVCGGGLSELNVEAGQAGAAHSPR
jgi:hypothetical protein